MFYFRKITFVLIGEVFIYSALYYNNKKNRPGGLTDIPYSDWAFGKYLSNLVRLRSYLCAQPLTHCDTFVSLITPAAIQLIRLISGYGIWKQHITRNAIHRHGKMDTVPFLLANSIQNFMALKLRSRLWRSPYKKYSPLNFYPVGRYCPFWERIAP